MEHAVLRPESTVTVWVVGESAEDSIVVASVEVPHPPRRLRSPTRHREQLRRDLLADLLERVAPALDESDEQRASAIATTLTLASRAERHVEHRFFFVLSDLRERSRFLDLECRRLPRSRQFQRRLDRQGLLQPGSFTADDTVQLLDLGLPSFPHGRRRRCDTSIRRSDQLRELWVEVIERAGASSITLVGRSPVFPVEQSADPTHSMIEGAAR